MQKYGIVNTDTLNLRSGPSTTARVISQLMKGSVLNILTDPGSDWLEVQPDGSTNRGYVAKTYLTLTDDKPGSVPAPAATPAQPAPSADTPSTPPIGKAEVTTDTLNIR